MDAVRSERASMDAAEFARAYGNIPDLSGARADRVDLSNWGACADPGSRVADPVAVGFSVAPDGSSSAVAVAGRRADGLGHGEVVDHWPGTAGVVPPGLEGGARGGPGRAGVDPAGARGGVVSRR